MWNAVTIQHVVLALPSAKSPHPSYVTRYRRGYALRCGIRLRIYGLRSVDRVISERDPAETYAYYAGGYVCDKKVCALFGELSLPTVCIDVLRLLTISPQVPPYRYSTVPRHSEQFPTQQQRNRLWHFVSGTTVVLLWKSEISGSSPGRRTVFDEWSASSTRELRC